MELCTLTYQPNEQRHSWYSYYYYYYIFAGLYLSNRDVNRQLTKSKLWAFLTEVIVYGEKMEKVVDRSLRSLSCQ